MGTVPVSQTQTLTRVKPNTLAALHGINFRLYFGGQFVSISGTFMQIVAQGYLIFQLTHSELWLGVVACVTGLPMLLMTPVAGVVVESMPRRRLLMMTQTIQMGLAFILAFLTFSGIVQIWHIVVLAFSLGFTNALDMPARQTFVVEVVGREDLHSGIALNSILNSMARILGPTAAGIALVKFGAAWCFLLNGLSFVAVLLSLFFMKVPYAIQHGRSVSPLNHLKEGLAFARQDNRVAPLLWLAGLVGLFVVPVIQLMPAVADVMLHSPKEGYAVVSMSQGIGSVIGGISVSWLAYRIGYGRLIALSLVLSAFSLIVLSLQSVVLFAAITTASMGLFLIWQVVCLNTQLQMSVPDQFRGRVLSLYTLALLGTAPFGALILGGIASVIGTPYALALYGVLSGVLGGVVLLKWSNLVTEG